MHQQLTGRTTVAIITLAVFMMIYATATAQQVTITPSAPASQCLVVDTLWITLDGAIQDVEAAYFAIGFDGTHLIPMAVIKAPDFDSSVFLDYTIFPNDSVVINLGFLVGNFDGPGNVAGIICAPGVSIMSSPISMQTSLLRDPNNAAISHTAVGATITTTCCCRFQGDLDSSGFIDILDIISSIDYTFRYGPVPFQDPGCPEHRGEVNCDQVPNAVDVITIINVAFRNYPQSTTFCNPCDCNPYPTGCP